MFQRSVGLNLNNVGGHSTRSTHDNAHNLQNENLIPHRGSLQKSNAKSGLRNNNLNVHGGIVKKNTSLTPSVSNKSSNTRRRAFGDISNKKGNGLQGVDKTNGKPFNLQQSNSKLIPQPNPFATAKSNEATRKNLSNRHNNNSILPERPSALLPFQTTVSGPAAREKSHLDVFAEDQLDSLIQKKHSVSILPKEEAFLKDEPVPDIELPAGRTWQQQLENELKGEDDAASTSTLDSILDCPSPNTAWKRIVENEAKFRWEEYEREGREVDEYFRALKERIMNEPEESFDELCSDLNTSKDNSMSHCIEDITLKEDWSTLDAIDDLFLEL